MYAGINLHAQMWHQNEEMEPIVELMALQQMRINNNNNDNDNNYNKNNNNNNNY